MTTIQLASTIHISNIWLLTDDFGRRFLIDSGHSTERALLLSWLWRHGVRRKGDLTAILLTHRHCDHADNAAFLRERFGAKVCIHENDADFLTGAKPSPKLRRGIGHLQDEIACAWEDRWPARSPVDEVFSEGPFAWGFTIFRGMGHTEGSSFIYHEASQTLFSGDVLLAGLPPFRMFERLGPAIAAYSVDVLAAHRNLIDFVSDPPPIARIAPGHGPLVTRNIPEKLTALRARVLAQLEESADAIEAENRVARPSPAVQEAGLSS